jgi:hypothetical protein
MPDPLTQLSYQVLTHGPKNSPDQLLNYVFAQVWLVFLMPAKMQMDKLLKNNAN